MSFSRPIQWYHSHVDPIWLDGMYLYDDSKKVWPSSDIVPLRLLLIVHGIWGNAE